MSFALTLIFTCGVGCGDPSEVTINQVYSSYSECDRAGQAWLSPDANPQGAVLTYSCSESTARGLATATIPANSSSGHPSGGGFFDELLSFFKKLFGG
jgi:hypothetical protein